MINNIPIMRGRARDDNMRPLIESENTIMPCTQAALFISC